MTEIHKDYLLGYLLAVAERVSSDAIQRIIICSAINKFLLEVMPDIESKFQDALLEDVKNKMLKMRE